MKIYKYLLILNIAFSFTQANAEVVFPYAPGGSLVSVDDLEENDKEVTLYELANENLRPETNEFYLSTIYGSSSDPRALIKRSNNARAGDLYTGAVEYKIGDNISDDYIIDDINFRKREVIVKDPYTNEYFALKLSYGSAKSKLIKKYDYAPKRK